MAAMVDWSFFNLDSPLPGMDEACSLALSADPWPAALGFENFDVLPEQTDEYTSLLYCQMGSYFDMPVVPTNRACKSFANTWNNGPTLTPPMTPRYNLESMPADSVVEAIDMNDGVVQDISPTPSLCADDDYLSAHSPISKKRSYSSISSSICSAVEKDDQEELPAAKHPKRRPGRPRLDRTSTSTPTSTSSSTSGKTQRVPHNQVEQKYRKGLNEQLERLRQAVPTLRQVGDGEQGKPSKAMVLAGAIEYIREIEQERDELARQVKLVRSAGTDIEDRRGQRRMAMI